MGAPFQPALALREVAFLVIPLSVSRLVQRHPALDAALKRLSGSLDLLEAATARLDRSEAERRDLDDVLAAMEDDRGRLAEELDAALKGRQALAEAAGEVAGRLRSAGTVLRGVIAARGETQPGEGA